MFVFFVWITMSVFVGWLAGERGRSFAGHFIASLVLSPLITLIIVMVQPDISDTVIDEETGELVKKQPVINQLSASYLNVYWEYADAIQMPAFCTHLMTKIDSGVPVSDADIEKALELISAKMAQTEE